jgi:hypothetical protein
MAMHGPSQTITRWRWIEQGFHECDAVTPGEIDEFVLADGSLGGF